MVAIRLNVNRLKLYGFRFSPLLTLSRNLLCACDNWQWLIAMRMHKCSVNNAIAGRHCGAVMCKFITLNIRHRHETESGTVVTQVLINNQALGSTGLKFTGKIVYE